MRNAVVVGTIMLSLAAMPALAQEAAKSSTAKRANDAFVLNAAKDGMAEVELGKLGVEKASRDEVKKFAQRMADDHSKANDELKSLAEKKAITLPTSVDAKHKATQDRLAKLSGAAFDRAYMQDMVSGHRKAVAAFRTESKSGKDADVKAWAAKTLPTLEEHLKQAQNTAKDVGAVGTSGTKRSSRSKK